jgi:hypothetical protein
MIMNNVIESADTDEKSQNENAPKSNTVLRRSTTSSLILPNGTLASQKRMSTRKSSTALKLSRKRSSNVRNNIPESNRLQKHVSAVDHFQLNRCLVQMSPKKVW